MIMNDRNVVLRVIIDVKNEGNEVITHTDTHYYLNGDVHHDLYYMGLIRDNESLINKSSNISVYKNKLKKFINYEQKKYTLKIIC